MTNYNLTRTLPYIGAAIGVISGCAVVLGYDSIPLAMEEARLPIVFPLVGSISSFSVIGLFAGSILERIIESETNSK
jgi:hypothetical protein